MSAPGTLHDEYGATYHEIGERRVVAHYGNPEREHLAVRNGVGVIEHPHDIVVVSGNDRVEYVDNAVSNAVSAAPGSGVYAVLLTPKGRVRMDLYVYTAEDRLLLFLPPGHAEALITDWREKVFIQDVAFEDATDDYRIFGVHGPDAVQKLESVLADASVPDDRLSFTAGVIEDAGVSVIRTDSLTGETGVQVVCATYDAPVVMETLLTRGLQAVPFGYHTWETLTLEAGTPLFETEIEGAIPNVLGLRVALDFDKGCYVGQEVVSRIENRGRPSQRLVGLTLEELPSPAAEVFAECDHIGHITRAAYSPSLEVPLALGIIPFDCEATKVTVESDSEQTAGQVRSLPFVEGSAGSARLPNYPD